MAFEVPIQGENSVYTATLKDETGAIITLASLASLTLTFRDKKTAQIINGRDNQNILNVNNVTVHATSGLLTWQMQPADNVIFDASIPAGDVEKHIANFKWQTTAGVIGKFEEEISVRKEMSVPVTGPTTLGSQTINGNLTVTGEAIFMSTPKADIRNYGASTTLADNSTAIQSAINSGAREIFIPKGDWNIASDLVLTNGVKLIGQGQTYSTGLGTRLIYTGSNYAIKLDDSTADCSDFGIMGMSIVGNANANGGIRLGGAGANFGGSRATLQNVLIATFAKSTAIGLTIEGMTSSSFSDVFIDMVAGTSLKIEALSTVQPGPLIFSNCTFGSGSNPKPSVCAEFLPTNAGIHSIIFDVCLFSSAQTYGVHFKPGTGGQRTSNITFDGCSFEINTIANAEIVRIEELFGANFSECSYTTGNKAGTKGFNFMNLGTKTISAVKIWGGTAVSFDATSYFIYVDQSGGATNFTRNFYGPVNLVAVTNEIFDAGGFLESYAYRKGGLIVPQLTTTQRNSLTAINGMIIYNTTTSQFEFRENGAWVIK